MTVKATLYSNTTLSHKNVSKTIAASSTSSLANLFRSKSTGTIKAPGSSKTTQVLTNVGLAAAPLVSIFGAVAATGVFKSSQNATPSEQEMNALKDAQKEYNNSKDENKDVAKSEFQLAISNGKEAVRANSAKMTENKATIKLNVNVIEQSNSTILELGPKITAKDNQITAFTADIEKYSVAPKDETPEAKTAREAKLKVAVDGKAAAEADLKVMKEKADAAKKAKSAASLENTKLSDENEELLDANTELDAKVRDAEAKLNGTKENKKEIKA